MTRVSPSSGALRTIAAFRLALPVMAMSGSSKRTRAVVGDRRRSAPHAGWLFAVNSDQVLRITVLAFAPVAGARAGGALWARAAGRAGAGACGLRSG